jgi:hypothetical protein
MKSLKVSKNTIEKKCLECGSLFLIYKSTLKTKNYKYCSIKCYNKNKTLLIGEKNKSWKGNKAGYFAIHCWIRRRLGSPSVCDVCGCNDKRKYEWANISGEYKRDISDYKRMCTSCHRKHDKTWLIRKRMNGRFV